MLKQRIQILQTGGVIGEDVARFTNQVIDMMAADYPGIDADRAAMFTTHLAMAVERIKKREVVEAMDDDVWEEVTQCPEYPVALAFRDKMLSFCPIPFPDSEGRFILLHICSMLQ